jgi:hypothetical protein
MGRTKTVTNKVAKARLFGFYENEKTLYPSLASCQCGSSMDCGGGGSGGRCQCGSSMDCSGSGSGGRCQCGSSMDCGGSG